MGNCCRKGGVSPPQALPQQPPLPPLSIPSETKEAPQEVQETTSPIGSDDFFPNPQTQLQVESPPSDLLGLSLSSREDSPPPLLKDRLTSGPAPAPLQALKSLAAAVPSQTYERLSEEGKTRKLFPRKILFPSSTRDVLVSFTSVQEYKEYFLALLDLELAAVRADVSKRLAGGYVWEVERRDGQYIYRVQVSSVENFTYGDLFVLASRSGAVESVAVTDIDDKGKTLEFTADISGGETVEFVQSLAHIRMTSQLCNVTEEHSLLPLLLGDPTASNDLPYDHSYELPDSLDTSQLSAITQALQSKITVIRGPPGSGKTMVAVNIAQELSISGEKVLICAPSNLAADQLMFTLTSFGGKAVRLYSPRMEERQVPFERYSYHRLLHNLANIQCPGDMQDAPPHLTRFQLRQYLDADIYSSLCSDILSEYPVLICTCLSACDPDIRNTDFQTVIIDEACSCIEPEAVAAVFTFQCARLVLLGDPQGLRPRILSEEAGNKGLEISPMERLEGGSSYLLTGQYRMPPMLSYFPLTWFHSIRPKDSPRRLPSTSNHLDVFTRSPLVFVSCKGREEPFEGTQSRRNLPEAKLVVSYFQRLLLQGFVLDDIGIITAYEGQRLTIIDLIKRKVKSCLYVYDKIDIGCVDTFQGREKEVVVISCVRGNLTGGGFLRDRNRVNIALTRAKRGVVVVGNPEVLRGDETWSAFLDHVRRLGDWVGPKEPTVRKTKPVTRFSLSHTSNISSP